MSNVPREMGPNSPWIPPGLPAELFGFGQSPWRQVQDACSTTSTIGVNATAMGALDILTSGNHPGFVVTDHTNSTLQSPRRTVIR